MIAVRISKIFYWVVVGFLSWGSAGCGTTPQIITPELTPSPVQLKPITPPLLPGETVTLGKGQDETHTFIIISGESQARYIVDEEFFADALSKLGIEAGRAIVQGISPGVSGQLLINFGQPDLLQGAQITVDMTGLQSDRSQRDNWLADNALEWSLFPEAKFTSTAVIQLPETYTEGQQIAFTLEGDLTIRDVTNRVMFEVTAMLTGDTLRGTASRKMQMTDFGITPPHFANTLTVANGFRIEIDLVARKQ
jgi:polyisoprenoid-binding protein YceI